MAHDTTVRFDPSEDRWAHWYVTCAEGDYTTDYVTEREEALDSAVWHAGQNGGQVVDDGLEKTT